jgi:formylglycine-generating enzyme required for sulfatase activity
MRETPVTTRRLFLRAMAAAGVVGLNARAPSAAQRGATNDRRVFDGREPGEERIVESVRLCWCPPGEFIMGSPPTESGRRWDETPVRVTLTRGFWMASFETTQGEWTRVMDALPTRAPSAEFGLGDRFPVYWVSYSDAEAFCSALTARARHSGSIRDAWELRIPTEAQWEYACRAGTTTATAFGDALGQHQANFSGEPRNGGQSVAAARRATSVGSYPPNRWGLYDMHGNIYEWCRDWYHTQLPGGVDPDLSGVKGVQNRDGTYSRARRGGAWNDDGRMLRSACRLRYEPERNSDHIGFRCVLVDRG